MELPLSESSRARGDGNGAADGESDVLVVGAGPTGLLLSSVLAGLGVRVRLIDQRSGRSELSKATGLEHRVSEILDFVGVSRELIEHGLDPRGVTIHRGGKDVVSLFFHCPGARAGHGAFQARGIVAPQSKTEELLEGVLLRRGARVEWGTTLLSHEQDEDGVAARIHTPEGTEETIRAAWLVSCQGAHSSVREREGIVFEGKVHWTRFLLADVTLMQSPWNPEMNHLWLHADGTCGALPQPGENRWRLTFEVSGNPELRNVEPSVELISTLASIRGAGRPPIAAAHYITSFDVEFRLAQRFRSGRVFLAGDAAHVNSPTGALGISNGMQDAINLSWKLARVVLDGAPAELLDTYEQERMPRLRDLMVRIERNADGLFARSPGRKFVRDKVLFPLLKLSSKRPKISGLTTLEHRYSETFLSAGDGDFAPGLESGDRVPDILFESWPDGSRTTLFACLGQHRPIVLLGEAYARNNPLRALSVIEALQELGLTAYVICRVRAVDRLQAHCLRDSAGELARIYGMNGGDWLCVIRPDGHLGLTQRTVNLNVLADYLRRLTASSSVKRAFGAIH
jgi:4,5-epoxidase